MLFPECAISGSKAGVVGLHTLREWGDGYRYEQDMTAQIGKSDDAKEAQAAFREKRAPVFTGR